MAGRRIGRNMHPGVPRRIGPRMPRPMGDGIDRSLGQDSVRFMGPPAHLPFDAVKGVFGGLHPDHDMSHGWQGALDGALDRAAGFVNSHPQVKSFVDAHKDQISSGIDRIEANHPNSKNILDAVKAKLGSV